MQNDNRENQVAENTGIKEAEQFSLGDLIERVRSCKENCYPNMATDGNGDVYSEFLLKAVLLVGSTIDSQRPNGFLPQQEGFNRLGPLPSGVDGRRLAYGLGPGMGLLKLHREVGKNWVLSEKGKELFAKHSTSGSLTPLVDQDRKYLIQGCNQKILFISEAPSADAWQKQALVSSNNDFLMRSLLPMLDISLEEFRKYFFWVHYSNCFPGLKESGGAPNPPKNSVCFEKHTKQFLHCRNWSAVVLMGRCAYQATGETLPLLDFLKADDCRPKRLINGVGAPVIVLPHCSGRNIKARTYLGDKYDEIWKTGSNFIKGLLNEENSIAIERVVDERLREYLVTDDIPKEKPILIIGDSRISRKVIFGVAKEYGYSGDRIEILDDYKKNKRFDVDSLQYSDRYSCVLIGPNSHKMLNLGSFDSLLSRIQHDEGFPYSLQLREKNGELKITKESLKIALEKLANASEH